MASASYKTFTAVDDKEGVLTVTFDNPPVNMQDLAMLKDLGVLADLLEKDSSVRVVVFQVHTMWPPNVIF